MMYFYGEDEYKEVSREMSRLDHIEDETGRKLHKIVKDARKAYLNGIKGMRIRFYDENEIESVYDDEGYCVAEKIYYLAEGFIPEKLIY